MQANSFLTTNHATGLRSTPDTWKPSASLHQRGAPAHEAVEHLKVFEVLGLLMIGIVHIPDCLRSFGLIGNGYAFGIEYRRTVLLLFGLALPLRRRAAWRERHCYDDVPTICSSDRWACRHCPPSRERALIGTMGKSTSRQVFGRLGLEKSGTLTLTAFPRFGGPASFSTMKFGGINLKAQMPADVQLPRREEWDGLSWMSCASS